MNESSGTDGRTSHTRRALLDAARLVVARHGLAGATSRQITAAAGANLAAITYHFGSKDDLIAEALFEELDRRLRPALLELESFDEAESAPAAMLAVVGRLLAEFERSRADAPVYLEALFLAARDPAYRQRALALTSSIRNRLERAIESLRSAGVVPAWVDPASMAALVLATANGIVLQALLDPDGPDQVAMTTQFAGLLVAAAGQR